MGRKIEVITEDNKSEPQEAVTVYRKMISSDKVDIFLSGCVSAGNFAGAPLTVRAQIPMVLCSILPQNPDHVKWAFSTLPPAGFEVATRLDYLKEKTQIKKIGVLHDPSPYAVLQKNIAEKTASNYGLELVGIEQYKQDDADLSVQISKMHAAGAGAILKIGLGGTTLTAAKNIKQLGLDMLMLTSVEDLAVFRPVAEVLGDKFFFVASPSQVYDALPDSPMKAEITKFLVPWKAKYKDRDPNWARARLGRRADHRHGDRARRRASRAPRCAMRSKPSPASRAPPASTTCRRPCIRASPSTRSCSRASSAGAS